MAPFWSIPGVEKKLDRACWPAEHMARLSPSTSFSFASRRGHQSLDGEFFFLQTCQIRKGRTSIWRRSDGRGKKKGWTVFSWGGSFGIAFEHSFKNFKKIIYSSLYIFFQFVGKCFYQKQKRCIGENIKFNCSHLNFLYFLIKKENSFKFLFT